MVSRNNSEHRGRKSMGVTFPCDTTPAGLPTTHTKICAVGTTAGAHCCRGVAYRLAGVGDARDCGRASLCGANMERVTANAQTACA